MNDIKIKVEGKKAYVYTPYNKSFTQKIKKKRIAEIDKLLLACECNVEAHR